MGSAASIHVGGGDHRYRFGRRVGLSHGPGTRFGDRIFVSSGDRSWFAGRSVGVLVALAAAVVSTYLDIWEGRPYAESFASYWNGGVRLAIFVVIGVLVGIIKRLTEGLQDLVKQRTAALEAEIQNRKEVERVVTEISAFEQQRLGAICTTNWPVI